MYLHFSKSENLDEISQNNILVYKWKDQINDQNDFYSIGDFKKVNLFVGTNNSGKSRFLRALLKFKVNELEVSKSRENINFLHEKFSEKFKTLFLNPNTELAKLKYLTRINNPYFDLIHNYHNYKIIIDENVIKFNKEKSLLGSLSKIKHSVKLKELEALKSLNELNDEVLFVRDNVGKEKKYIPVLRSLHDNSNLRSDSFEQTIKKNYNISKDVLYTGLSIFNEILNLKNSRKEERDKVNEFEKFLSHHFFDNKEVNITSDIKSEKILFSVDGVEHPVHEIGNGIQSLIIILFPIFTANKNDWFFIEEPETNLHPGLQRVFIETLLNDEYLKTKNLRFFFTTHSNHFLDTSLINDNVSIFQFKKESNNTFIIKNNIKPNKEVIDLLGVKSTSVFLANTSLWVEGPTDRKYLSKFLKLYCETNGFQPLKEDIDFAFFEYGGNLIEHYLFEENEEFDENEIREKINSFALSSKIYLLSDNDNPKENSKKYLRQEKLNKLSNVNSNFFYQNTIVKEIENLLPKKIIQDFMSEILIDEESKDKAVKIRFKITDYNNVGLGKFYEDLFLKRKIPKKSIRKFKAESGTLKNEYKNKLANFFIKSEYKYSDLIEDNDQLKKLIEKLYVFVKK